MIYELLVIAFIVVPTGTMDRQNKGETLNYNSIIQTIEQFRSEEKNVI